jgi:GT2 family glycosyltransferase
MDLSIIIVNYRGWTHLKKCLDPLTAFKHRILQTEVIIVDNDSDDGKLEDFKSSYPGLTFISNKVNGGFSNGCNLGSKLAKGDYLLFLNPDTVASETEVEKLFERAKKHPENFISSCRQVNDNGRESKAYGIFPDYGTLTGFERAIYKLVKKKKLREKTQIADNVICPDWVSGSVMLIKTEVFKNIDGFDEDYWMYYEDTDICRRVRNKGANIAYYLDVTIQHNHGGSSRINLDTTSLTKAEVKISNHIYISKHKSGVDRILIQGYLIILNLLGGLFSAILGSLLFVVPKLHVKALIYFRLVGYYFGVFKHRSWISPRSVNFKK